jgi:cellulose synthase (UDP-forming)
VVGSNCLYRRKDLEALGGFPPGSLSEDIELSLALGKRGRRTRWVRAARARAHVAGTLGHFWRQRTRWTSGMYHSRREVRGLEGLFTVNGYADRLIFVAAVGLAWWGILHPIWIALYLAAPLAAMLIALARAEDPGPRWLYLFVTPLMFAVDVAASITATVLHLLGHRAEWRTDRA